MLVRKAIFCLFLTCAGVFQIFAQPGGSVLEGTVRDANNSIIAGAAVKLMSAQQVVVRETVTDSEGRFRLVSRGPGSFVVIVEQSGFRQFKKPVSLSDNVISMDVVLDAYGVEEQVTITAETGLASEKSSVPQSLNVIDSAAIAARTTGVLAQIATGETGVSLQRTSPTIGAVLVRGLTEVGVYVDGVRFTNSTQRSGINTFFNLNEQTSLQSIEIQRSPNTAQFGSDGLGGNVQLLSRQPAFGFDKNRFNGEFNSFFGSADNSFGSNALLNYGTKRTGILGNFNGRRINTLRTGGGIDSHSALTRLLGVASNASGSSRLPDTAFSQFGALVQVTFAPTDDQQFSFRYQRSQQDGGKRYDQLLGGDGNLIADLRNLMLDFGYARYTTQRIPFFDSFSATVSFNSQREERVNQGGQGNALATVTNDKERTSTTGLSFFADRHFKRNSILIGGDFYRDAVSSVSFNTEPSNGSVLLVRPRVPNGAHYNLAGVYYQQTAELLPEILRLSGAFRLNLGSYRVRALDAPLVNGVRLFPDDAARFSDFSGRIGAVLRLSKNINTAFNYSRGFRAPNVTSLGALGLAGVGFQVSTESVKGLGAEIGNTADANAVSTGIAASPLRSEISDNFDLSFRLRTNRTNAELTAFLVDYKDAIVRQTLILPAGAVGLQLGSQTITGQNTNGAVFVSLSANPVLIQANYNSTRLHGFELNVEHQFFRNWTAAGNVSSVRAVDRITGGIPNLGGGGLPPVQGFLRLRFETDNRKLMLEAYSNLAGRQARLSTLDLADRRTGAARSRSQIRSFFERGACVRGITTTGLNGLCNSTGGILTVTGETLLQVQDRLLPLGSTVNGVFVANDNTSVPMFNSIPGYALLNLRGTVRFNENYELSFDFHNITDKSFRAPGWGIDGSGRGLTTQFRIRF